MSNKFKAPGALKIVKRLGDATKEANAKQGIPFTPGGVILIPVFEFNPLALRAAFNEGLVKTTRIGDGRAHPETYVRLTDKGEKFYKERKWVK